MTDKDSFHFCVFLDQLNPGIEKSFYFLGSLLIGRLSFIFSFEFGIPNLNQFLVLLLLLFNLVILVDINFFLGGLSLCQPGRNWLRGGI